MWLSILRLRSRALGEGGRGMGDGGWGTGEQLTPNSESLFAFRSPLPASRASRFPRFPLPASPKTQPSDLHSCLWVGSETRLTAQLERRVRKPTFGRSPTGAPLSR